MALAAIARRAVVVGLLVGTLPVAGPAAPASSVALPHASAGVAPSQVSPPQAGRARTWGIGDSVMLGSKPLLARRGVPVDARVSRQFVQAVPVVAALARSGRLAGNVVVHLGTNGSIKPADCRALVNAAGPARRLFLLTDKAPRPWAAPNNRVLRRCARAFPTGRVVVVDWAAAAAAHPRWLGRDGIHPSPAGRVAYVALITSAVARWGR